jgi:AbrB family looped-hinge helix DNA binding protein
MSTIGPKGQVVIPQEYRLAMNIHPGSKVQFKKEQGRLYLESTEDPVAVFERIAKSGPSIDKFDPHEAYEASMRSRMHVYSNGKCSI